MSGRDSDHPRRERIEFYDRIPFDVIGGCVEATPTAVSRPDRGSGRVVGVRGGPYLSRSNEQGPILAALTRMGPT